MYKKIATTTAAAAAVTLGKIEENGPERCYFVAIGWPQ